MPDQNTYQRESGFQKDDRIIARKEKRVPTHI
jgi:hypothetical protein